MNLLTSNCWIFSSIISLMSFFLHCSQIRVNVTFFFFFLFLIMYVCLQCDFISTEKSNFINQLLCLSIRGKVFSLSRKSKKNITSELDIPYLKLRIVKICITVVIILNIKKVYRHDDKNNARKMALYFQTNAALVQ